jgi:signal transduction histidine kinase
MRGENLCIEDTGIGIASEDIPRIFEKGYTGFNGRIDPKASGLGLYLCKRICENLGIGISAQSEVGTGTVIALSLEQYTIKPE